MVIHEHARTDPHQENTLYIISLEESGTSESKKKKVINSSKYIQIMNWPAKKKL